MIAYVEKGIGMHDAILQQGHWLGQDDRGIWQSSDDKAVQAIIDAYVEPAPTLPDLSRPQFAYLLGLGLGDVWDAVQETLRDMDRELYARLRAERERSVYKFDVVLAMVEQFKPFIPPGVDLSRDALAAVWLKASELPAPVAD